MGTRKPVYVDRTRKLALAEARRALEEAIHEGPEIPGDAASEAAHRERVKDREHEQLLAKLAVRPDSSVPYDD
ncbi:hypothetical protein VSR82_00095 [Burkholderia sp. JPY481]